MSLPVFVISLPQSADRRASASRAWAALPRRAEIVDAVDGRTLGPLPVLSVCQPHLGRALTPGEVGCLESHLALLRRIVDDGLPMGCICEDDIQLADDCAEVLDALDRMAAAGRRPAWDVLLLGHHSARCPPASGAVTSYWSSPLTGRRRQARVAEFAMGAYAYVVTRQGAARLLDLARPLRMPFDWVVGYAPAAGLRVYGVTPPCVTPDAEVAWPSTIDGREFAGPWHPAPPGARARGVAGRLWLAARRLGLWPDSYARRY